MNEPGKRSSTILTTVARYYADRLERFGTTPKGVDWNSGESQELRFDRLLEIVALEPDPKETSILDIGCGYGAFLDYLRARGLAFDYVGYDVSDEMIEAAKARHVHTPDGVFTADAASLLPATYAVASGIFNVRLQYDVSEWREHVVETLDAMHAHSLRGFAFNMLTTYSDEERRRPDLFYADPCEMFDLCKRRFSRDVALLHDYPLFEFTILVRK